MRWSWIARALCLVLGTGALCGALPGEMHSCDTDLSDEVDHVVYCRERCMMVCDRVVECGLYHREDAPEGVTIEELCQGECEEYFYCIDPQICDNDDRYISEVEAETCLADWRALTCDELVRGAPRCGADFGQCPRIETCAREELCDPPEWE